MALVLMNKLKSLYQDIYFKKGAFFFISGIVANILYYFYRVVMGKMLGPELFGELVAIISLVLILTVPSASVQLAAARFSTIFEAKGYSYSVKDLSPNGVNKIRNFFRYLTQVISLISLGLIICAFIFARVLQNFLKLSSPNYIYFLIGIVVVMLILGVSKGILQGLERFSQLAISTIAESIGKVGFALVLVILGFKMTGALGGFLISLILSYFLTIYFLRDVIAKSNPSSLPTASERYGAGEQRETRDERQETREIWKYIFNSCLVFVFLNVLINIDKILVKHYFSSFEAGIFSAFSTLGQAIFVAVSLLATIMFPLVVSKQAQKEDCSKELKIISLISLILVILVSLIFFLFSKELLLLFFGNRYLAGASFLGYYGLAMGILGFIFLLSYFLIALNKFKFLYILVAGTVLEILLISIWHSSFSQVILMILLSSMFTLLWLGFLIKSYGKYNFNL